MTLEEMQKHLKEFVILRAGRNYKTAEKLKDPLFDFAQELFKSEKDVVGNLPIDTIDN